MKHFNRKIKGALLILFICLIAFIGFSKAGILFSDNGKNVITVSTTKKTFDPNNYIASVAEVTSIRKTTTMITTTTTIAPTTTKEVVTTTSSVDNSLTFEGKNISEIGAIINKTLGGILAGTGETFARLSLEKGMDPYLLAAISVHETGNGTSSAARNKYNFGGIMCSKGLCSYSSVDDGLTSYVNVVYRNYYSVGLTTPEAMNPKYAASTSWATKVTSWYNAIKNK